MKKKNHSAPIRPLSDGRAPDGRFLPGNPGGPGNPLAKRVAVLRTALLDAVDEGTLRDIVQALLTKAKSGDVLAAREILDRVLGKPAPGPTLEAADAVVFRAVVAWLEARSELRRQAGRDYVGIDNGRLTAKEAVQVARELGVPLPSKPPVRTVGRVDLLLEESEEEGC